MAFELCQANRDERRRPLPGDELITRPMSIVTHAVTIGVPPDSVWPWIVQLGSGRAGWYSYDHIDNGGVSSARRIVPELQQVEPGDVMPSLPGAQDSFIVAAIRPEHALILVAPLDTAPNASPLNTPLRVSWAIILEPLDRGRTRLISRGRISPDWLAATGARPSDAREHFVIERVYALMAKLPRPILLRFATSGHYVMESRMLRGIKARAEGRLVEERHDQPRSGRSAAHA